MHTSGGVHVGFHTRYARNPRAHASNDACTCGAGGKAAVIDLRDALDEWDKVLLALERGVLGHQLVAPGEHIAHVGRERALGDRRLVLSDQLALLAALLGRNVLKRLLLRRGQGLPLGTRVLERLGHRLTRALEVGLLELFRQEDGERVAALTGGAPVFDTQRHSIEGQQMLTQKRGRCDKTEKNERTRVGR